MKKVPRRGTRFLSRERKLCKKSGLAMEASGAIFDVSASLVGYGI